MTFSLMKNPIGSFNRLWVKFSKDKKFRDAYVAGYVKRAIPSQIRALMKKRGHTQQQLAELSDLTQGVISRAADLNYGDLTLNTILKIGAGFDCAFVGKYVPYGEFLKEVDKGVVTNIPTFEKENEDIQKGQEKDPGAPLGSEAQKTPRKPMGTGKPQRAEMREEA